jgi:DNA-binding MarR family transcriptional regulator
MATSKSASLADSIKQTQPFAGLEHEAYLSILRTATQLSHWTDQFLKGHGVTQAQFNVLRILRGARPEGLCRNEIADRMVTAMPDVSRLLDRMEKTGWIKRERSREDRRQVATVITSKGLQLLTRLGKPLVELHREQFKGVAKIRLRELLTLMTAIRSTIP